MNKLRTMTELALYSWQVSPRRVLALAILLFLAGFLEGAGFLMLVPLLDAAGLGAAQANPQLASWLAPVTRLLPPGSLGAVLVLVVALIGLRAVVHHLQAVLGARHNADVALRARTDLFRALMQARWRFLSRQKMADLTFAATEQADIVSHAVSLSQRLGVAFVTLLVGFAIAAAISWQATLAIAAIGILIAPLLSRFNKSAYAAGQDSEVRMRALYGQLSRAFTGLKAAKVFGAEQAMANRLSASAHALGNANVEIARNHARAVSVYEIASAIGFAVVAYVAFHFTDGNAASLVILVVIFSRIAPRGQSFLASYRSLLSCLPHFEAAKVWVASATGAREAALTNGATLSLTRAMEFRRATLDYGRDGSAALVEASFVLPAGSSLAIVGRSGAGKTTLCDLACGLLAPTGGSILIDGKSVDDQNRAAWRSRTAYVLQDEYLFDGTIRDNLLLDRETAGDRELWGALAAANANDFVAAMPGQLDAVIQEGGADLSRGQRQRLCIARALLRSPDLLILDEATSAINPIDEGEVLKTIERLAGVLTIMFISHRVSTALWADQVVLLDAGRVVEAGSPKELASKSGSQFKAMLDAGLGSEG